MYRKYGNINKAVDDRRPKRRAGYSLIELLTVIGIIAFLVSLSGVFYANMVDRAREVATAATIGKISGLLDSRVQGFTNHIDGLLKSPRTRDPLLRQMQIQLGNPFGNQVGPKTLAILVRKEQYRASFPQRFVETYGADGVPGNPGDDDGMNGADDLGELGWPGSDDSIIAKTLRETFTTPANHNQESESAELLYAAITASNVFGPSPTSTDDFDTKEIGDTDNDGLLEFVDSWGEPLRFYRWPTRLIKPDGSTIDRQTAGLLILGLPSPPPLGADRDALDQDPDDLLGYLTAGTPGQPPFLDPVVNESTLHTLDTYHVPLIVSGGPDETPGLYEPYDTANFGHLARPLNFDTMTDDISNRNQRAGGN